MLGLAGFCQPRARLEKRTKRGSVMDNGKMDVVITAVYVPSQLW
jgi:hypothetical protein